MGCITLEFIIWLLYGSDGLDHFNQSIGHDSPMYQTTTMVEGKVARVHDVVVRWLDYMSGLPACEPGSTAIGSLLEVVKNNLLAVKLPKGLGSMTGSPRRRSLSNMAPRTSDVDVMPASSSTASLEANMAPGSIPAIKISEHVDEKLTEDLENIGISAGQGRARANDLVLLMDHIMLEEDTSDSYWSIQDFADLRLPQHLSGHRRNEHQASIMVVSTRHNDEGTKTSVPGSTAKQTVFFPRPANITQSYLLAPERVDYGSPQFDEFWKRSVDNKLAAVLFDIYRRYPDPSSLRAEPTRKLCGTCQCSERLLREPVFSEEYNLGTLRYSAEQAKCNLCALLWAACQQTARPPPTTARFDRKGSYIHINSSGGPALSISVTPSFSLPSENENSEIQVGLVRLPPLNSDAHFEVIRQWLADCDENHGCMTTDSHKPISATRSQLLPTRVIDVSPPGSADVRPVETARGSTGRWIAVSHQWGAKPCTVKSNLASHLKGIPLSSLPATFADAVKVTRALGCQYLWIDSIFVVQKEEDDPGDFNKEMKNMEQYYSGAYCVLGLSAGEGHGAGFLAERKRREVVTFEGGGGGQFHIAEAIDDFGKHVLQGPLRSRGWVSQEHALARRTVFFTEAQTYWECGEGLGARRAQG